MDKFFTKIINNQTMERKFLVSDIWNNMHPLTHVWIISSAVGVMCLYGALFVM